MHDGKQLIHAFDDLWHKYHKRLVACHHEAGEEAVHKLRIATRRLQASIELFLSLAPRRELRKLRKALKGQLDSFDDLRDSQVMLLEISSALQKLPELYPFLKHLQIREQRVSAGTPAMIEDMRSNPLQPLFKKSREKLVHELGKSTLKPQIQKTIDDLYQTALERYQSIDIVQPATIHQTRITLKKLRYMLEASESLLPQLPENHLTQIHSYLTSMGEIQDSAVLLFALKTFFSEDIPESIQVHYQHRHSKIINNYMSRREEIMQFWRLKPDQPFPWES